MHWAKLIAYNMKLVQQLANILKNKHTILATRHNITEFHSYKTKPLNAVPDYEQCKMNQALLLK